MIKRKKLFLRIFAAMVLVFFIGVFLGNSMGSPGSTKISDIIKNNELNTQSYLIEQEFMKNFEKASCEFSKIRVDELSQELWKVGTSLSSENAEKQLGKKNYMTLKVRYHLLQIRTYILFKKISQNCDLGNHVVLFYFSKSNQESTEQGLILDEIVENYDVSVFAIEYNYSKEMEFLESYYEIKEVPTVIIDYKDKIEGLASYNEIEAVIKRNS